MRQSNPTSIVGYPQGIAVGHEWLLAAETAVALAYNGQSYAVMMATPADLFDFAVGFTLSESIVATASEVEDCTVDDSAHGITVSMSIPPARAQALGERRRAMAGRSGCGLCGIEHLEAAIRLPSALPAGATIADAAIARAFAHLPEHQPQNARNHSVHAAAWVAHDGRIAFAREDVGRHNALDKLIGAMSAAGVSAADGFVCMTSRCSVELVQKAAAVGITTLATLSAPTALAVSMAKGACMSLATRGRGGVVVRF